MFWLNCILNIQFLCCCVVLFYSLFLVLLLSCLYAGSSLGLSLVVSLFCLFRVERGFIGVGDKACLFYFFVVVVIIVVIYCWFFGSTAFCCWFLRGRGAKILLHALSYLGTVHGLTTSRSSANVQSGLPLRASVRELCVVVVGLGGYMWGVAPPQGRCFVGLGVCRFEFVLFV